MTIFNQIVTNSLIEGIDFIIKKSSDEDGSSLNAAREGLQTAYNHAAPYAKLGFFDFTRNTTLSEKKRAQLRELKSTIMQLSTKNNVKDEEIFTQLIMAMSTNHTNITRLCKDAKIYNEGKTGTLLKQLFSFLEHTYPKICVDMNLANIPCDQNNAINCIQYYAAKSCSQYLYDEHFRETILRAPQLLVEEKEALILKNLNVLGIDLNKETAKGNEKQIVIDRAKIVQRDNEEINGHVTLSSLLYKDHLNLCMSEVISTLNEQVNEDNVVMITLVNKDKGDSRSGSPVAGVTNNNDTFFSSVKSEIPKTEETPVVDLGHMQASNKGGKKKGNHPNFP